MIYDVGYILIPTTPGPKSDRGFDHLIDSMSCFHGNSANGPDDENQMQGKQLRIYLAILYY